MRKLLQRLSWGRVSKGGQVTRTVYRTGISAQSHGLGTIEEREVCGGRDRCVRLGLGQVEFGYPSLHRSLRFREGSRLVPV